MVRAMRFPDPLPRTLTARFKEPLMRGIFTYAQYSDVTPSRLLQRAVERELARLARTDQKLKLKLEKVMKNGTTTRNHIG
jgi:hypothetical protein